MAIKVTITPDMKIMSELFGSDSEANLQFRSSVVQEFAKRYLKAVAHSNMIMPIAQGIREEVRSQLRQLVGDLDWAGNVKKFSPEFRDRIREEVKKMLDAEINAAILGAANKIGGAEELTKQITDIVDNKMNNISDRIIRQAVVDKIKAIAESIK